MSSTQAKRLHSVNFRQKNTWDDWKLIPIKRPVFDPPSHKYISVDIMGADGEIDLSDALTDYPVFNNRRGTLKFRMFATERRASSRYSEIMNYLHGQRMQCILDEEPEYYYYGRFTVSGFEYKRIGEWADIAIDYNVEPYKYLIHDSTEEWLWDPFSFETGVIRNYSGIRVSGSLLYTVVGTRMPVIPVFTAEIESGNSLTVDFEGNTYSLADGVNTIPAIVLTEGEHNLGFRGNGRVTIAFRGGSL